MKVAAAGDELLLREIMRCIVDAAHPLKIILFGSRARGGHGPGSDLDILVIEESSEPRHIRARNLYGAVSGIERDVDVDIVVYTPREAWEWSAVPDALVTTAIREGKVVYEEPTGPG